MQGLKSGPMEGLPREKLERYGAEKLADLELLAILLNTGSKSKNVMQMAEEMLRKAGGLRGFKDLSFAELTAMEGIGPSKATTILAALELGKRVLGEAGMARQSITSSAQAAELLIPHLADYDREHFVTVQLNRQNAIVGIDTVSVGTVSESLVHPREVFKGAIRQSASSVILAHNHPGGVLEPSAQDIQVTRRLQEAGKVIGIDVADHIIVAGNRYYSFLEHQQM